LKEKRSKKSLIQMLEDGLSIRLQAFASTWSCFFFLQSLKCAL